MVTHISVPIDDSIELLEFEEISPLISKVKIKVCYVSDEPNRNDTIITKEFAKKMAVGLRGCPIVGYYNEDIQDFEEHERALSVKDNELVFLDITKPYGFVDLNAKIWFQKFQDDFGEIQEYLCTEGYIWDKSYPEAKMILDEGTNQSLEIYKESVKGNWTRDFNSTNKFFIFSEGLIEKLCILGKEKEPCFEGAKIATEFSLETLEKQLNTLKDLGLSMINDIQKYNKGGKESMEQDILEKEQVQVNDTKNIEEPVSEEFSKNEDKEKELNNSENQDNNEEYVCGGGSGSSNDKKKKYSLEEVEEYTQLLSEYNLLKTELDNLKSEIQPLREFKANKDKEAKVEMINSFYMISEEDKKPIMDKIDEYSLDEIESKLAVIGYRKKINFSFGEETEVEKVNTTYNLNESNDFDDTPEWIKAVKETASGKK